MQLFKSLQRRKALSFSAIFFVAASLLFASCDRLDFKGTKARLPEVASAEAPVQSVGDLISPREKFAFHRWLVTEMQEQVFARPIKDKANIVGWANVLSQRGSIEGVYHGLVLSSEYAELEKSKPADVKAVRFFAKEMALLDHPSSAENDANVLSLTEKYAKSSMGTAVYTMKRELGERVLREADARKLDREKLAAWYSGIAARWARLDIPFGIQQRNEKDEVFHFNWAKENTLGMIQWELLNRLHRILNQYGRLTPNPVGK